LGADDCCDIRVFPRVEVHLDHDILVPDLAGRRRERMPKLPEIAWFELPPHWVCVILSPSTAKVDRAEKLPIDARRGVRHAWLCALWKCSRTAPRIFSQREP
jgi:Uma2 family endonuclease